MALVEENNFSDKVRLFVCIIFTLFRIGDPLQLGLSVCHYVCLSKGQGVLVIRFMYSPILYRSYRFLFYSNKAPNANNIHMECLFLFSKLNSKHEYFMKYFLFYEAIVVFIPFKYYLLSLMNSIDIEN